MSEHPLAVRTPGQLAVRSVIEKLEESMRAGIASGELPETLRDGVTDEGNDECQHYFAEGVYARGLLLPAGTCVVGKLHKQSRICFIMSGRCRFIDEFHELEVEGPWIGEFRGGSKTAVFAITDTYWVAVTGTHLTDPQQILRELSAPTHADYNLYIENKGETP